MNYFQKLTRSLEMLREPLHQICMRSKQQFIRHIAPTSFSAGYFFQNVLRQPSCFYELFPKVNHTLRTTALNLNVIQPTAHKHPQARANFSKCPPSAILFLTDSPKTLIRDHQKYPENHHITCMRSSPRFLRYRAHKLFGRTSLKIAAYGIVLKQYMEIIAQAHRSCL